METLYQTGNTVRLSCLFTKEEEGKEEVLFNPHNVIFRVMNYKYEVLDEFLLDESHNSSIGEWFYDFTLPKEETRLIYEWQGYINGQLFDKRRTIRTTFI